MQLNPQASSYIAGAAERMVSRVGTAVARIDESLVAAKALRNDTALLDDALNVTRDGGFDDAIDGLLQLSESTGNPAWGLFADTSSAGRALRAATDEAYDGARYLGTIDDEVGSIAMYATARQLHVDTIDTNILATKVEDLFRSGPTRNEFLTAMDPIESELAELKRLAEHVIKNSPS